MGQPDMFDIKWDCPHTVDERGEHFIDEYTMKCEKCKKVIYGLPNCKVCCIEPEELKVKTNMKTKLTLLVCPKCGALYDVW